MEHVVVVGASLAGLRACETLRQEGFTGTITLIGAEDEIPYDRPPLSKKVLAGEWPVDRIRLRKAEEFYDRELRRRVKRLTDLMAPAITVVMGAVLLFVLASVLLPLYRAYSAISGGAA